MNQGCDFYFNNPVDYLANMEGEHLDWLRRRVHLTLVVGQGPWEDDSASGALASTRRLAGVLAEKAIPHELDLWGYDSAHDWPWWGRQMAVHLPRLAADCSHPDLCLRRPEIGHRLGRTRRSHDGAERAGLLEDPELAVGTRALAGDGLRRRRPPAATELVDDVVDELEQLVHEVGHRHLGLPAEVDQ